MAAKIRLKQVGRKGKIFYRIVVADESSKRDGKVIATLGYVDNSRPSRSHVNKEELAKWYSYGAQSTESVKKLLKSIVN